VSARSPTSAPTFVTIPETAARLKVSPKTVRRWIEHGTLKAHRFGKQIRIAESDLAAFIEGCRQ
jgi:excisionase family DNA binding protein